MLPGAAHGEHERNQVTSANFHELLVEEAEAVHTEPAHVSTVHHKPCEPPPLPGCDSYAPLGVPPPMMVKKDQVVELSAEVEHVTTWAPPSGWSSENQGLATGSLTAEIHKLLESHQGRLMQHIDMWMAKQEKLVERVLGSKQPAHAHGGRAQSVHGAHKPVKPFVHGNGAPAHARQSQHNRQSSAAKNRQSNATNNRQSNAAFRQSLATLNRPSVPASTGNLSRQSTGGSAHGQPRAAHKCKSIHWGEDQHHITAYHSSEGFSEEKEDHGSKTNEEKRASNGFHLFAGIFGSKSKEPEADEDSEDGGEEKLGVAARLENVANWLHATVCEDKKDKVQRELLRQETKEHLAKVKRQSRKSKKSTRSELGTLVTFGDRVSHDEWSSECSPSMSKVHSHNSAASNDGGFAQVAPGEASVRSSFDQPFPDDPNRDAPSALTLLAPGPPKTCREWLRRMIAHSAFELFFGITIISNAMYIGVEVDWTRAHPKAVTPTAFYVIGYTYTFLFSVELLLRIVAEGKNFCLIANGGWHHIMWNSLDVIIVLSSLVEFGLDLYQFSQASEDGMDSVSMSNMRLIRIIRVTRLMRLFRIGRIVKFVRALRTLVYSIVHTMKSVIWAMLLLTMIMYVFGILFTQAAMDYFLAIDMGYMEPTLDEVQAETLRYHYGTLADSMLTLFMSISGGVSWVDVCRPLREVDVVWLIIFLVFMSFTYFAVLNVVTGIFCQSAIESQQADQETMIQAFLTNQRSFTKRFKQIFMTIDTDGSGLITLPEFMEHIEDPKVQAYFATLDLEPRDAVSLFKLLDEGQGSDDGIDVEDFVMGCLRLKGPAKSYDMARLMAENRQIQKLIREFALWIQENFEQQWEDTVVAPMQLVEEEDYLGSRRATDECAVSEVLSELRRGTMWSTAQKNSNKGGKQDDAGSTENSTDPKRGTIWKATKTEPALPGSGDDGLEHRSVSDVSVVSSMVQRVKTMVMK